MSTINQQLDRYARPQLISTDKNDIQSPFSFRSWYQAHRGIIPGQEYKQYNDYLLQWYKDKNAQTVDFKTQLRINYLTLLRQVQLFFTKEEADNWYNNIDLNNDKELLLSIPYFAKKLKDISLYYLQLRENIKHSRLLYNQTGTESGILLQLQKFLLNNYTQKPDTTISIPPTIWKNVPALSSIKDTITLQVEDLYDFHDYYDQTTDVPVSAYYDLTNADLQNFLTSKNLTLTSSEWIYRLGTYSVSGDLTPRDSALPEVPLLSDIVQKYIGQDLYTALAPVLSAQKDFYVMPIEVGNNFFYWPYGPYVSSDFNPKRYTSVALSSVGLETLATGGSSIELADTIFVKTKKGVQGAWLHNIPYSRQEKTMEAIIPASKKIKFKFPFPGYGLSGDDFEWTGPGLVTDNRFFYLEDKYKQAVEQTYWSTTYGLTSINQISINDTNLIDNKAYASRSYDLADKVRYWTEPPAYNEPSYIGEVKEAWLYRMNTTDISIAPGDNVVYWPFEKISSSDSFPTYFPTDVTNFCTSIPVSNVKLPFATAGKALTAGADMIFKIRNYQDSKDDAIECCWLSGQDSFYPKYSTLATKQPGLNLLLQPGEFTRFVWDGGDNVSVDSVFGNFKHQPDCEFSTNPDLTYKDHEKCSCRQVLFAPFGHPNDNYTDKTFLADFIAEDTFTPRSINIDSTYFNNSKTYCWYQTNSKIGWGDGKWVSKNNALYNRFNLKKGQAYIYYRANEKIDSETTNSLPELVIRYPYSQYESEYNKSLVWLKAVKDENDNWVSTNERSRMVLFPGDTLIYSKFDTATYNLSTNVIATRTVTENRGSIWSNYDYVTINNSLNEVVVAPPVTFYPGISTLNQGDPYKQYVNLQPPTLQRVVQWIITSPDNRISRLTNGEPIITFTPTLTGLYTIGLTALTAQSVVLSGTVPISIYQFTSAFNASTETARISTIQGYAFINTIPPITAISEKYNTISLTSIQIPQVGFAMNTPLEGWDYNRSIYSPYTASENRGARPYWAITGVVKNEFTSFKGIESWGQALRLTDRHNVISQPLFSDIIFNIGNYIEYIRNYPVEMTWIQPVTLFYPINQNIWSTLNFNTTAISNFANFLKNTQNQLVVNTTTDPSPIMLTNVVEDEPVEVYYNALSSFTWPITAESEILITTYSEPSVSLGVKAARPWSNLLNQFNPTVAAFPAFEDLYSVTDTGGFFTPNNLGISVYTDKDYTAEYNLSSTAYSGYFEDVKKHVGGRGLSKTDNPTPYKITEENNIWLKESLLSGPIAGSVNKQVFKKFQKFIPYQSGYESNPRLRVGLISPASIQTPWTGKEDSEWGDLANYPKTYTGEVDVSKWADSQILKQNKLEVDNWVTDIFGNQYGLYKNLDGTLPNDRKNISGEIWVRKNSQYTSPAKIALENVFDTYKTIPLYNELTGIGIKKIDMFFDTLYVETTGLVLFEKINYDYDNDVVFSLADEARYISLPLPVTTNISRELTSTNLPTNIAKVGETWFFPNEKKVIISVCGLENNILTPELYALDTNLLNLTKVFPVLESDKILVNELSGLNTSSINSPVLTHNTLKKEFILTLQAGTNIIEFNIRDLPVLELTNITVYQSTVQTDSQIPPYISQNLTITTTTNTSFEFECSTVNSSTTFISTSTPTWVNLNQINSNTCKFIGTAPNTTGTYFVEFYVENSVGKTYYTLSIIVQ